MRRPIPPARRRHRTLLCVSAALLVAAPAAACDVGRVQSGSAEPATVDGQSSADAAVAAPTGGASTAPEAPDPTTPPPAGRAAPAGGTAPVTLAFGGDTHTMGSAASVLDGLGPISSTLQAADVAVVNLETAIVSGSGAAAQPKTYVFQAPPEVLPALAASGVDVVTMANNHGLDYGQGGLRDTLAATAANPVPAVLGIGDTPARAWQPYETTVNGRSIGIIAATDVLDDLTWAAVTGPGLASAKGTQEQTLLANVRDLAGRMDTAVVVLHWGQERVACPTQRQQELAAALVAAGADVVVGSHAHVLQPLATVDGATVAYGMGNFGWYNGSGVTGASGVLTVTIQPDGTQSTAWQPAQIAGGLPQPSGPVTERPTTSCG